MEALLSLAGYSYEHPDDPFPEFVAREANAPAVFVGAATGASADSGCGVRA